MTAPVPKPLRITLVLIGALLTVMAVVALMTAAANGWNDWWLAISFAIAAVVCIVIAATGGKRRLTS